MYAYMYVAMNVCMYLVMFIRTYYVAMCMYLCFGIRT